MAAGKWPGPSEPLEAGAGDSISSQDCRGGHESPGVRACGRRSFLPPQSSAEARRMALRPVQPFSQAIAREAFGPMCRD